MERGVAKNIAKGILYSGWGTLFILGFLIPNNYYMIFRMTGILLSVLGAFLLLAFSRKKER